MIEKILQKIKHPPLSRKEQGLFAERLSFLLGASLSLPEAIAVMRNAFGKKRAPGFARLEGALDGGTGFESALVLSPLGFDRVMILAARIGERSGTLAESLRAAAGRIERRRAIEAALMSALAYPLIIFLASLGIISFLAFYIMPKIIPTIESLHVPLPLVTRFFIVTSRFLADDWWKATLAAVFLASILFFFYKRSRGFKASVHRIILCLPFAAKAVRAHVIAELFDGISTLASAGCPFIDAVSESLAFQGLVPYRAVLSGAIEEMRSGSSFSSILARYENLFPALAVESLAIGERTGNIDAVLSQISRYYARELESALSSFGKLVEPALMIAVGCVVGAAALSIVLPVYEISQHLSG